MFLQDKTVERQHCIVFYLNKIRAFDVLWFSCWYFTNFWTK